MLKSLFSFSRRASIMGFILFCSSVMQSCAKEATSLSAKEGYLILTDENPANKETNTYWANYLYEHLKNRCTDKDIVTQTSSDKDLCRINIKISPSSEYDFKIERNNTDITLITSNDRNMLWLQYQLMKKIGDEDSRMEVSDLPPAIISLNDTAGLFPFEYREVYLPDNRNPEYSAIIGADNLDFEWGIWGHNLPKVLGKDNLPQDMYAMINGKRDDEQYCFSSENLYSRLEAYITDKFGASEEKSIRFMIIPNDNNLVCTCPDCLKAGNTPQSATPAVTKLITRLAKRFPNHSFFTIAYLTTREVPKQRLPKNAGVMISAIDLPLRPVSENNKLYDSFANTLNEWRKVTDKIYIWDYINNFDDYLSPFPILKTAQSRLLFFRKNGVKGIFFNGSGDEYSTFDKLNTFVLSSLLLQPDLSVSTLTEKYLKQNFPISGTLLKDFYHAMEQQLSLSGKALNLYGSIKEAERTYLNIPNFVNTYNKIEKILPKTKGEERRRLNELLVGLTFTRLEIARMRTYELYGYAERHGNNLKVRPEISHLLKRLSEHNSFPNMKYYCERNNSIKEYIDGWNRYILNIEQPYNLLLGKKLSALSTLDEDYSDLSVITDGTAGLPDNYHHGWLISSLGNLEISLPAKEVREARLFKMTFLNDAKHRIQLPLRVEIIKNGKTYKVFPVSSSKEDESIGAALGELDAKDAQTLSIKVIRPDGNKVQIATDEILLMP